MDEHQSVGSADSDVVQSAGEAQGDAAGVVDAVGADLVGVGSFAGGGFGPCGVDRGWGGPDGAGSSAVGGGVVLVEEVIDLALQLGECGGVRQGDEVLFEGLVKALGRQGLR